MRANNLMRNTNPASRGALRLRDHATVGLVVAMLAGLIATVGCTGPTATAPTDDEQPAADTALETESPEVTNPATTNGTADGGPTVPVADTAAVAEASPEPRPQITSSQGVISGTVTTADGTGVVDAAVTILEGTAPYPEMAVFTDAEGRWRWTVTPGTYVLEAYHPNYLENTVETTVGAGETIETTIVVESK